MRKIGYARVSTKKQELSSQVDELKKYGCSKIFTDIVSGAKSERVGLADCLKYLKGGDVLVVTRLDRLGRSMQHLVQTVTDLKEKNIAFKSLRDGSIDTTTASGQLVFNIFSALAEFERQLIRERTKVGLEAARARGKTGGRKPINPNDPKVITAKKMHKDNSISIDEICSTLNVSRATFYRYLKI